MADAYSGDRNFRITFKDTFHDLLEQKVSVLYDTVRNDPDHMEGKFGYFDRLGSVEFQPQTTRHGIIDITEVPHSRRFISRTTHDLTMMVDRADARKMAKDPERIARKYASKGYTAHKRLIDDTIIAAFDGDATAIDEDDGQSAVSFPSGQNIAVNFQYGGGGSASGLTFDKIRRAFQLLAGNEVDMDEVDDLYAVVGERQWVDLLGITQAQTTDSVAKKHLVDPNTIDFMGFRWKRSTRLKTDGSGYRKCFFYHKEAMGVAIDEEPFTDISRNPERKAQVQAHLEAEVAATRIEEERIVRVLCSEA